jgi:ergothioneine biosynthesis protein EgtB
MSLIDSIHTPRDRALGAAADRRRLLDRYRSVRGWTSRIIEPLEVEDMVVQTSTECSPTKWQLGHTTWFFETFILSSLSGYNEYHELYSFLFNSYYNSVGERVARPIRGLMSRPTVREVLDYRRHVDEAIENAIEHQDDEWWTKIAPIFELGIHHEQQHQELMITDVKTVLALNPLLPVYRAREIMHAKMKPMEWRAFDGGLIEIGHSGDSFAFDNEGPRHRVYLQPFEFADRLVTNLEFMEFMADGAYSDPRHWLSEGWAYVQTHGLSAPKYWERRDEEWWMMTLQGFRNVEPTEPVTHVSHFEADAYATWAGARLPTEFEWEQAATWEPKDHGNFLESLNFHPAALSSSSTGEALSQLYGDTWQWTRSAYLPYPGYSPQPGALGEYNGKFMSNQMVLRGASCATPRDHSRLTYRNFFPSDARWQFTGIRLSRDVE